ncbi:unnamed protein product [Prorocentrum cordatum]|uniref:Reverse transcriptase domain-containing protein n=1 Tax=Prorocentrum cordatum TaxID=2364126 RepID=A0ABN9UU36_9DINO|nr:unnamed protein product [Polarella glacialis]
MSTRTTYWRSLANCAATCDSLDGCVRAVQSAIDDVADHLESSSRRSACPHRLDQEKFVEVVRERKGRPPRDPCLPSALALHSKRKGTHNKRTLLKMIDPPLWGSVPPVELSIGGVVSADRYAWAAELRRVAEAKFSSSADDQSRLQHKVEHRRGVATSEKHDRLSRPPSLDDFVKMLTSLSTNSSPGPDGILPKAWKLAPVWLKLRIFHIFRRRWFDVTWHEQAPDTWGEHVVRGIMENRSAVTLDDFRWIGLMDHLFKLYDAWSLASVPTTMPRRLKSFAFGYQRNQSVEDMLALLFELVCYALRRKGADLAIYCMDVLTAYDSVRFLDVVDVYLSKGATYSQVLNMIRNMLGSQVTLDIPGVAQHGPINQTRALRTGGKTDPEKFVMMMDEAMSKCALEWDTMAYGFRLLDSGRQLIEASWVDNVFLLARSWAEADFMTPMLTDVLANHFGWKWKPKSLEILAVGLTPLRASRVVRSSTAALTFAVKDRIEVLGGVFANDRPQQALLEYRLVKADKSFYGHLKHFRGNAPVSIKLQVFSSVPRSIASFLLRFMPCKACTLKDICTWERKQFRTLFLHAAEPEPNQKRVSERDSFEDM